MNNFNFILCYFLDAKLSGIQNKKLLLTKINFCLMSKPDTQISQRIISAINFDKRIFFILLSLLFILVRFVINDIILETIPGHEELSKDGSLTFFHIFNGLNYIWTPFSILWKVTVICFFIWTGSFGLGFKISYLDLWKFVLVAEAIFLLPELITMLVFLNAGQGIQFEQIKQYFPLSLAALVDLSIISSKYHYPLKSLNLFEVFYALFLVLGVHTYSKRNLKESALIVIVGYLLPFLSWLTFYVLAYR